MESENSREDLEVAAPVGRAWPEVMAVAAGVVAFVALVWLGRGELGMTWDEPYFFERQHAIRDWLGQVLAGPEARARAFRREGLEEGWRVAREVPDQHGPVPELLSLATGTAFGRVLGPLRAYRISTVIVFAIAAGVLFRLVRRRWGPWAAGAALGALLFNPRPFADAQQITADMDVGCFWFLAAVAFLRSCETGRRPWLFGVLAGLATMCKLTGVLVVPATLAWAILYRPKGAWRPLLWSAPAMLATMVAVTPVWWPDPAGGIARWVRGFLSYPQKVPVYYLGTVYDSVRRFLPWHNTIVLTGTMVPVGLLATGAAGLAAVGWRAIRGREGPTGPGPTALSDRAVGGWAAIHFLTWMVLRMTPYLPAHDGLRQLLPSFLFFPVLAGIGAETLVRSAGWLGRGAVVAGLAGAAWATLSIHPFELAYYNELIGGPPGAKAAGMETTFFWDAATDEVLGWMNAHLPPRATVLIFPPPNVLTFGWDRRWGKLRQDLTVLNLDPPHFESRLSLMRGEAPCFLVFQMRQGLYMPRFRGGDPGPFARLAESPALYELAPARAGGVRLLAIFDQADFRAVFDRRIPDGPRP